MEFIRSFCLFLLGISYFDEHYKGRKYDLISGRDWQLDHTMTFLFLFFLRRHQVLSINVLFKSQWEDFSKETFTSIFSISTKEYTMQKTQAKVRLNSIRKKTSIHSDLAILWASRRPVRTSLGKFYDCTWILTTLNQFTNARMVLGLIRMVQLVMCFKYRIGNIREQ